MVTLWLRWSSRDLRARWPQVLAIAAIIAIGTALFSGLTSTAQWRQQSYDRSYATLNTHDLKVALTPGSFAPAGSLAAVVASTSLPGEVAASVERLSFPSQVDASTNNATILIAGRIIGADPDAAVDRVAVLTGRALTSVDNGAPTAIADVHFTNHYKLPTSGTVRVGANRELSYVGHGEAPEQFLSLTDSGSLFAEASFAFFYTSLSTAQQFSGATGQVNELVVRLHDTTRRGEAATVLRAAFAANAPNLAVQVTTIDDNRVRAYLYGDIDSDQRFFNIFAFLVLSGAAFAAFNLTGRMVEAQRREIGIGMALGARRISLAVRPLLVALQIVALGVVLGIAGGLGINQMMRGLLKTFLPLPVWETPLQAGSFFRGALLGILVPVAATVWPIVRAVRVTPIEALRTSQYAHRGGRLAPLLRRLRLPGTSVDQMPLRDLLRAPRRTVLTTLGVAASIATLVAVIGTVDTFFSTIDRGEREILSGNPRRMTVELTGFQPLDGAAAQKVLKAASIDRAVPALQLAATLSSPTSTEAFDVFLTVVDFGNSVWVPTAQEGTLQPGSRGIVLSEKAARDLRVEVGDIVSLRHPRRSSATDFALVDSATPVVAIHPNPYRFVAFMDTANAGLFNLAGAVNLFQITPKDRATATDVQRELFGTPGIAAAQPVDEVVNAIRDFIGEILDILNVARGGVVLLAVLIAFNSASINADERRRQYATMFAFGLPVRRVVAMTVIESFLIGVISTAVGIGLGYAIVDWIVNTMIPDTMPDLGVLTHVSGSTYLTAAILGVVAVSIAPLFTVHRLTRMAIPDTLRVQE